MSWEDLPKPDGVGDITETDDGFQTSISIPTDEDGFFGRECPSCEAPFKMRVEEYDALPDEINLTCPYCGHREEHSAFMSASQQARALATAQGLAEQWMPRAAQRHPRERVWAAVAAAPPRLVHQCRVELHTRGATARRREVCARLLTNAVTSERLR